MKKLLLAMICLIVSSCIYAGTNQDPKPIIAQFFGIWLETDEQAWKDKFRDDTPFDKLNRIYIAFAKIVPLGEKHFKIAFDGEAQHAQAIIDRVRAINPEAEIFISLAGKSSLFVKASADHQFPQEVVKFLQLYGFQGLDVDWELDSDWSTDKYKSALNSLITNLYTTLHPMGYKLTYDLMPGKHPAYDMPVLINNIDQFNLMSYGYETDLEELTEYFINSLGVPPEKIIGGIETEVNYNENGWHMDSLGPNGTIVKKAKYSVKRKLAGMMEWHLDNDNNNSEEPNRPSYKGAYELWNAMMQSSHKQING